MSRILAVLALVLATVTAQLMPGEDPMIGPIKSKRPPFPAFHLKEGTLFDNKTDACNFFVNKSMVVAPWPKNC